MNGYICFYRGQRHEVYAATSLSAQTILARKLKVKKPYEISVHLAEQNVTVNSHGVPTAHGEQVTHTADF